MKKNILIIEEAPLLRKRTAELLKLAGYNAVCASSGREGLQLIAQQAYELILCSMKMQDLDGYGVLRAYNNMPALHGSAFVFMAGRSTPEEIRKGMNLGADDYLMKPFSGDSLLSLVGAQLKKKEQRKIYQASQCAEALAVLKPQSLEQNMETLTSGKTTKKLRKKDILYTEGDTPNFLYFIISGKVKLCNSNKFGKEYINAIYKTGEFLGYNSLLGSTNHFETAEAIEESEVRLIPKQDFFELLAGNNEVALQFAKLLARNICESNDKMLKLAYDSARKRVGEAIIFISTKFQNESNVDELFSGQRENISSLSGISPESVSRHVSNFKDEGLIESHHGGIRIVNRSKLEMIRY
jgi:CRP-like cAMP-binding protein